MSDKIIPAVRQGAISFAGSITCGAVAFAAREVPFLAIGFVMFLSAIFGFLSAIQFKD